MSKERRGSNNEPYFLQIRNHYHHCHNSSLSLKRTKRPPLKYLSTLLLFCAISRFIPLSEGVEYFLDEDEHVQSALGNGKVPKIPPEIRVLAKYGEFHKTIYDLPNTETVLRETHFQLDPYDFAHWNDTHHSNGWERSHSGKIDPNHYNHPADTTDIYLECTSFYPVEWVYEGDGVSGFLFIFVSVILRFFFK